MKRTVFTAIALTTVLAFFAPLAQAESLRFSLSNGQPDSIYRPFGRSTEAVDNSTLSDRGDL
ncbi:hypothetical protein N836_28020 [Leptolyngbya sp. Heron Island J]|uniref:hypothetical protein n=1 Tax=Leptolyngbya sp. Heron Island J TaxID=1385935 RepID=UPI0003B9ED16|nr:hypothetical protein [Leptolyngbya sp. Heron Island J]ESA32004.1 hypothetical protein N836_28020 [Leptolyngbya sp. Heron Island J]